MQISEYQDYFGVARSNYTMPASQSDAEKTAQDPNRAKKDSVNISDEARALFAKKLRAAKSSEEQDKTMQRMREAERASKLMGIDDPEEAQAILDAAEAEKGKVPEPGSTAAIEEQIKKVEEQIKELSSQLITIVNGAGDNEQKLQEAAPVQQQLQAAESLLEQLKGQLSDMQKNAPAKPAGENKAAAMGQGGGQTSGQAGGASGGGVASAAKSTPKVARG